MQCAVVVRLAPSVFTVGSRCLNLPAIAASSSQASVLPLPLPSKSKSRLILPNKQEPWPLLHHRRTTRSFQCNCACLLDRRQDEHAILAQQLTASRSQILLHIHHRALVFESCTENIVYRRCDQDEAVNCRSPIHVCGSWVGRRREKLESPHEGQEQHGNDVDDVAASLAQVEAGRGQRLAPIAAVENTWNASD